MLWKPEEGIESAESRVGMRCPMWILGAELSSSGPSTRTFTTETPFQLDQCYLNINKT